MKVLLDTCIIIDFLQSRDPFADTAKEIMYAAASESFKGYITAKSAADIYYLTRKCTHSESESRSKLSKLLTVVEMLDSKAEDVLNAIHSDIADFEDAIMTETAIRSEIDCIVTRNVKDYEKSPITVYLPHDFIEILKTS